MIGIQASKSGKRRELTRESFDCLLTALAADRAEAAEKYQHIHQALIVFFAIRGASDPPDLADETINRVAGRLSQGAEIFTSDPASYFFGVARNVWREALAQPVRDLPLDEMNPADRRLTSDPDEMLAQAEQQREVERRIECLNQCLGKLPLKDRELIIGYYQGAGGAKIENRQALAERHGISPKTLRNKTTLLRARITDCVSNCLASRPAEPQSSD
jgi:RNA polymerase sigma factor (sigma-70 family)